MTPGRYPNLTSGMPFDLRDFTLHDMLRLGGELRKRAQGAEFMEAAADAIIRHLYESCADPNTGGRSCAMVRFYKTHPYERLAPDLQRFAQGLLGNRPASPSMRCLTLLATTGDEPAWRSRHRSRSHQAVPLPSAEIVQQAPMIARLIQQLGLELGAVAAPAPNLVHPIEGRSCGVFHVEEALGSPYIPAQEEFVVRYGIRSVLGFGGTLRTGDLFAVILFARVHIPPGSADRFRSIALEVKSAIFGFGEDEVFATSDVRKLRGDRDG